MLLKAVTLFACVVVAFADGKSLSELPLGRVVNGITAKPGDAPWHALVRVFTTDGYQWVCSGALISNQWVITTAECLRGVQSISVLLGATEFGVGQAVAARRFVVHPKYVSPEEHDIPADFNLALIQLARPIAINRNIKPINLPGLRFENFSFDNHLVQLSGYGTYDPEQPFYSSLQLGNLRVVRSDVCWQRYETFGGIICTVPTGGHPMYPGFGDIGAPLVWVHENRKELIGIFAYGPVEEVLQGAPAGFIRVSGHLRWISDVTRIRI